MKRARPTLLCIAAGIVLLLGAWWLFPPAVGLVNRLTRMPDEVRAPYVERLSQSASVAHAQCERLVDAWRTRQDYGLRRTRLTIEATPVEVWLITSGGKLTLVLDYTRDSYSNRAIRTLHPESVELVGDKPEPHQNGEWFPGRHCYYLRCRVSDGTEWHF